MSNPNTPQTPFQIVFKICLFSCDFFSVTYLSQRHEKCNWGEIFIRVNIYVLISLRFFYQMVTKWGY